MSASLLVISAAVGLCAMAIQALALFGLRTTDRPGRGGAWLGLPVAPALALLLYVVSRSPLASVLLHLQLPLAMSMCG